MESKKLPAEVGSIAIKRTINEPHSEIDELSSKDLKKRGRSITNKQKNFDNIVTVFNKSLENAKKYPTSVSAMHIETLHKWWELMNLDYKKVAKIKCPKCSKLLKASCGTCGDVYPEIEVVDQAALKTVSASTNKMLDKIAANLSSETKNMQLNVTVQKTVTVVSEVIAAFVDKSRQDDAIVYYMKRAEEELNNEHN